MENKKLAYFLAGLAALLMSGCNWFSSKPTVPTVLNVPYPGPTSATICAVYSYTATTPVAGTATSGTGIPWLSLGAAGTSVTLNGTPQGNDWGSWPLSVSGSDSAGNSVEVTGNINVTPQPTIAVSPPEFKWRVPQALSPQVTITVTPACVYTITLAVKDTAPKTLVFDTVPSSGTLTTGKDGKATTRVNASAHPESPNDEGTLVLTITSNAPGGATVTKEIKIKHVPRP